MVSVYDFLCEPFIVRRQTYIMEAYLGSHRDLSTSVTYVLYPMQPFNVRGDVSKGNFSIQQTIIT